MSLIHGKSITSEEIEHIVSRRFTPKLFASLCNAIAWASAGRRCSSLPSFTERVNAKDRGIDVEWQTELPDDHNYSSPLLGPGWNVFQYKKRDIFAQGRDKTFSNLKTGLKSAVKDLHEKTGRRPDRYTLFTNLDLIHDQKISLKQKILEDYDQPDKIHVEVVGAAELSSFLNSLPHLRSAFFAPAKFSTWEEAWHAHTRQKIFGANVELIGRDKELGILCSFIDDTKVRVIVLSGPPNIGKTRLVLQATAHRPIETVVALDPRSMNVSDLLSLESPGMETIVIIEDPDPDRADEFVNQVFAHKNLKLLITLPIAENAPAPNFGQDERLQVIRLDPLSDSQAQELLKVAGAKFDYSIESWVIQQAGGNPGILLLAASLGTDLRKTAETFVDDVAKTFEQKARRELGDRAIEILRLLSLLTHVGIRGAFFKEIEAICTLFGNGIHPNEILNSLPRLESAGIVQIRGSYAEVLPPLFANSLATSALRGRFTELYILFTVLNQAAQLRLIRRLQAVKGDEVSHFWDKLFGPNGLLKDLPTALANRYLLRPVAEACPERIARLIEEGLKSMALEERFAIVGNVRRELIWAIERLLFCKRTSIAAIRCLAMLAEAETENYANNATGVFCECFHPFHPQLPLPLQDRLNLLNEILSPERSVKLRLIGVKAIESGLRRMGAITLRRSNGPIPLDARPSMTYGDVSNYIEGLVDLLMTVAQSEEPELTKSARVTLPHAIAECAIQARPETAIERFQIIIDWAIKHGMPISISNLAESLRLAHRVFTERRDKADRLTAIKFQDYAQRIEALISLIDKGDFSIRLKRWAGNWTPEDHEYEIEKSGKDMYRYERELQALAEEAIKNPGNLTDDHLTWLCSEEAKKAHTFFWWLGKMDSDRKWVAKIEEIGANKNGVTVFSAYFGGLSLTNREFVSKRLDELTEAGQVMAEAIVSATGYLGGDMAGVKRMEMLIRGGRVDPVFVERVLSCGGWINSLSPNEYLRLLKAIVGPEMNNAPVVIDFLRMWLHAKRPIEGELAEFAWQCLEAAQPIKGNDTYNCDWLASNLAQYDPERGFKLLEKLLTQPYEKKYWNPIDHRRQNKFWSILRKADRKRALRFVLSLALRDPLQRITWDLHEIIDQESDADILITFALEGKRQAELVCECITAGRPCFWPIALKIIEKYPDSRKIQDTLARSVEQRDWLWEVYSIHLENCRRDVERVLNDATTPVAARPWLKRLELSLRAEAERQLILEIDEEVNELKYLMEDPTVPGGLWAISTLLQLGKLEKIRKLLSKDKLLTILPKLQLPKNELEEICRKVKNWE